MIRITSVSLDKIKPEDYKRCYSLNFRSAGTMQRKLVHYKRYRPTKAKVFMAKENGVLVGWSLVFTTGRVNPDAHFYVRHDCRQRGIATRLMKKVLSENPKIIVSPHSKSSAIFFSQFRKSIASPARNSYYFRMADNYKRTGRWG